MTPPLGRIDKFELAYAPIHAAKTNMEKILRKMIVCLQMGLMIACQPAKTETQVPTATEPTARIPTLIVEGTPYPFETIERDEGGYGDVDKYYGKGSWMNILVQQCDIDKIEGLISEQSQKTLWNMEFDEYLVVAVFQGLQPSTGYGVQILEVTQIGDRILVYADFKTPGPDEGVGDSITLPSELIQLRKEGLDGTLLFELVVNNKKAHQARIQINERGRCLDSEKTATPIVATHPTKTPEPESYPEPVYPTSTVRAYP